MPHPDDTEEGFFQDRLDADANDQAARWLLAEWLAERGDVRATGYHWMVQHGKAPDQDRIRMVQERTWDWWSMRGETQRQNRDLNKLPDRIAPVLMDALDKYAKKSGWSRDRAYCEFWTRLQAEESLIRALIQLGFLDDSENRRDVEFS